MNYKLYRMSDRKDLRSELKELNSVSWPEFFKHGDTPHWYNLFEELDSFQLMLCDSDTDKLIGAGFTVPVNWDKSVDSLPKTIDDIILNGIRSLKNKNLKTLVAIGVIVSDEARGKHLSSKILSDMKQLAFSESLPNLIVPVRPTWKEKYPLQRIDEYAKWKRADGLFFDPWLRVHQRLGAEIIKVTDCTLTVKGSVAEWESWTGMLFPFTGSYIVPGALVPITIDVKNNSGIYKDPNIWMQHPVK